MTSDPEPFPASAQYLTQSMDDPADDEPEDQEKKPRKRGKKPLSKRKQRLSKASKARKASAAPTANARPELPQTPAAPAYVPGEFCAARDRFVSRTRQLLKVDYRTASELWNRSNEKKAYLKHMPLPELKRRRFVPKEATCNPFA